MLDKKFKSLEKLQDYYISLFKRKSEDEQHLSPAISKLMDKNLFSEYEKHIKIMSYNDKFDMRIAIGQKKLLKKQIKQNHKYSIKLHKYLRKKDKCNLKNEVLDTKKEISVELKNTVCSPKQSYFSKTCLKVESIRNQKSEIKKKYNYSFNCLKCLLIKWHSQRVAVAPQHMAGKLCE